MPLPKDELEQRISKTQSKLQEISINMESLDREFNHIMGELGLKAEEVKAFVKDSSNFSLPIWERLKEEEKKLNDNLHLSLKNIQDPTQVKKTFAEKALIQPHWIFVR